MSWLARIWSRATSWLEAGSREVAVRRAQGADGDEDLPWDPDSVAVLETGPTLDLHHFHPGDLPSLVDEYLRSAHEKGLDEVLLIHGRGKGVQRSRVAKLLERHPLVESFGPGAGAAGQGATVARLRSRVGRGKTKPKRKTSRPI